MTTTMIDFSIASNYKNNSQIARIATEAWVHDVIYCPCCGNSHLDKFENNRPVADFFCSQCNEEFELKSSKRRIGNIISAGEYNSMISRLTSGSSPNLFVMSYSPNEGIVKSFFAIPKQFLIPSIIMKRKPLSHVARRAGWVGCNINLGDIPKSGKIDYLLNGAFIDVFAVTKQFKRTAFLRNHNDFNSKRWLIDTLDCVDKIGGEKFTIAQMYSFKTDLALKHPDNNNIEAKIRQQLQVLRDMMIIKFIGNGVYIVL